MPYPEKIKEAVDRIGGHRVMFGSDGPVCSPVLEKEKIGMAGLKSGDQTQVLGGNAMRLLGRTS